MSTERKIGNVNLLVLHNPTESSVAAFQNIGNVNVLVYNREKADLMQRLHIGNVNLVVEVEPQTRVEQVMGQMTLSRDQFKGTGAPLCLVVMGQVIVDRDVPAEDIDQRLQKLVVMGQLIYPEPLTGVIEPKARVMGQTAAYPPHAQVKTGDLTLDATYLGSLVDSTDLAVIGSVRIPRVLPNDLLQRKLGKLYVWGSILVHEENAQALNEKLVRKTEEMTVIPAGYMLVDRPLDLNGSLLEFLPERRLFCSERVTIGADVDAALLDQYVDAIQSEELILCPLALKGVLARKCDMFATRAVFYEGELMLVDDARHLYADRLNQVAGKLTLVVTGELVIDPGVSPQALNEKVLKVHNLGHITCSPDQITVIEAHLGLHEGKVVPLSHPEHADGQETEGGIGNLNILELG